MRRAFLEAVLLLGLTPLLLVAQGGGTAPQLAPTPPMGWNSWDSYGMGITEAEYKANADWMAKRLKAFGWQYAVLDAGWYLQNPESGGKPAWQYTLDKEGRFMPAPNRFPSAANGAGFKPLADYVHSLGLKFGIHIFVAFRAKRLQRTCRLPACRIMRLMPLTNPTRASGIPTTMG